MPRARPSAITATTRARPGVSRAAPPSASTHPGAGLSACSAFTRNAIASTSPGKASVYAATQSTNRRSASGIGGASSTAVISFSRLSPTPMSVGGPSAPSQTTPTSSRRFSGTSTTSPGRGSAPAGTA